MSLRFRLNILITATFVALLLLATAAVVYDARRAVAAEIESTAGLAIQLLDVAVAGAEPLQQAELRKHLLQRMGEFERARHLHIALREGDRGLSLTSPEGSGGATAAPAWFVRLVQPEPMEFSRPISGARMPYTEIIVRADPADEITEAWRSARDVLALLLLFSVIANGLLWFTIGRWLRPVEVIVAALGDIEQGHLKSRLPKFSLPELTSIAAKVNHLGEALQRSQEENRYLAQQSLAIQEAERRLLARELHDELGQSISAINAVAVAMTGQHKGSPTTADPAAGAIADISSHIYAVLRRMLRRLRPVVLDEFGLVAALGELVDSWNERHPDAFCRLETRGHLDDTGGDTLDIHLYRIVQESLTNVSKHAAAREVTVKLERMSGSAGDAIRLSVSDDGAGFKPGSRRGLGLLGIEERVAAMQGHLEVDTAPGKGTHLVIEVPLQKAAVKRGRAA